MQLHTIRGTVPVEGVEPGTLQTTFSLVAADFHTFFAGKGMVLTHDNTIRSRPTALCRVWQPVQRRYLPELLRLEIGPSDLYNPPEPWPVESA